MKSIKVVALLFAMVGLAAAQDKVVRWGDPSIPKESYGNYYEDGALITEYKDENVLYSLTIHTDIDKKYVGFWLIIQNLAETPFVISQDNFDLQFTGNPELLRPAPIDEVAKDIEKRGRWRMAFAGALAGMATRNSTAIVSDNQGSVSTVTITEPDRQAQANSQRARNNNASSNARKSAAFKDIALKKNTMFKRTIIDGVVFFRKPKKFPSGLILSFVAGGTRYEIPFGSERVKNDKK